jgi:hypothetical protein
MVRWIFVLVVVTVVGCKKDRCAPARKAASAAVVDAFNEAERTRDTLKRQADEMRLSVGTIAQSKKDFDDKLRLFEQSLGCLQFDDCCKRLSKMSMPDRALAWGIGLDIGTHESVIATPKLDELMAKDGTGLNSPVAKEVQAWCESVRAEITEIRKGEPAHWQQRTATAMKDADVVAAQATAQGRRVTALGEWAQALKDSKKPTIVPDLGEGTPAFSAARDTVKAYRAACF